MLERKLFPGQQDDEEIKLVVREHWFFLAIKIVAWLVFVVILFAFDHYTPIYLPGMANYPQYVALFKNIYVMFLVLGLFMLWTIYYLNVQIITNKRVVDITQTSIFGQRISELTLPNIEDVTSIVNGFFGTVLSYGDVQIQTAGERENFTFHNVPDPRNIEKLIFAELGQFKPPPVGNE